MRNFVQRGETVTLPAPYDVASGAGLLVGSLFGVASGAAVQDADVEAATIGVFDVKKKAATTFAVGAPVSWDDTNKQCDAPGAGLYPIGVAVAAAGNGDATVRVRLNGVATAAAA